MITAIIQARMGSTRLPGKVLKGVDGVPILRLLVDRLKLSELLDCIVIATSVNIVDDEIEDFCRLNQIKCFRGSEDDVLGRYYECARTYKSDIIVRVTGDCPLIDPVILDKTVRLLKDGKADFAANTVPPDNSLFPDGSDVEVFTMQSLERAQIECKDPHDREHVTFYFWKYDNGFKTIQLMNKNDYSGYRFTLDYPEDLEVVTFLLTELKRLGQFGHLDEIVKIFESNTEIKNKNSKYYFGIGWKQ